MIFNLNILVKFNTTIVTKKRGFEILQFEYSGTQDQLYAVYYIQFYSQQKNLKQWFLMKQAFNLTLCHCTCTPTVFANLTAIYRFY